MSTENDRCMDSDTLMVNITDAPNIGMVNFTSPTGCEANGQINITADGGQGPLRYSIDNGTTFQDEADFDNLGAGTYNIVVANQDEVCTSSYSESISMIIAGAPTVDSLTVIPPNECKNVQGSITASGSSADPADVIEYSIDEGNTWQTSGTFSDLAEGSYNLAIRIQGSNCSTTFDNNPIEISQVADLRITTPPGDKIICGESDKTVQLELSETITDHNITGGLYTNDIVNDNVLTFIVDPVADGSLYSVTITGQSGCSITEEFTLTPGEDAATWSDNVVINNTPASCAGNDGSLDVIVNGNNNGFTFCWEPNKASGPMREGLSPDSTYTLTVTSSVGCTAVFDNIQTGSTCEVPSCNIFTGLDTLNAFVVDGQATACIPIADMDLSEFQFYVDGARQQMQFGECMQTSVSYAYQDIFETGQAPFTLTKWTVNNDTLSNFEFNTVEDLVVQLNQFDFQANWVLNESLKTIQGFSTANIYGTLNIQSNDANQVMEISLSTLNTMYQSIILGAARGIKKYTLKDPLNDCEDDLFIKVQGLDDGMDTLDLVTIVNTPITNQCLNTEETGTENLEIKVCDDPSVGILNSIDDGDACFGYMPATDFVGKDFFCLELCNGDICDTTIVRVTVNEEGLLFFTGFSPNNDGINDVFSIKNIESYPENNVTIYNRWGNRMFQKENYTNKEGWDGTFTGKMAPDGIYFYLVKVKINEEEEVFSGPVTLSR